MTTLQGYHIEVVLLLKLLVYHLNNIQLIKQNHLSKRAVDVTHLRSIVHEVSLVNFVKTIQTNTHTLSTLRPHFKTFLK